MKKSSLFLMSLVMLSTMNVWAAPIDSVRALDVAERFMPVQHAASNTGTAKAPARQTSEIVYTHYMPNSGRPAIYVVNIGNGFALVSADDVAHPILGYNYGKAWPAEGEALPPSVKGFLDDLAAQMEKASEHPQDAETAAEWRQPGKRPRKAPARAKNGETLPDSVGPLLTTTWGQGQYYNALCPEEGQAPYEYDGHVPTGCVATAMAQIIKYWGDRDTIKTRGIHSYDSDYGTLRVNYDSTSYDFANMPDQLTAESTPEQVNAVAKLIYECGVAVNMGFGAVESSAYDQEARAALINFYRFSPDASFAEKSFFTQQAWDSLLHANIANNQPVYYGGRDEQFNSGHAFVCDGYNNSGYYHFNFGWGGFSDGWYLTEAIYVNGMQYQSQQAIIVGLIPDKTGNIILGQAIGNSTFIVEEPLEYFHLMGHNAYEGTSYDNGCYSSINFVSSDASKQLVTDILEYEDQNITIYDYSNGDTLRSLYAGGVNDLSPVVSTGDKMQLMYIGNLYHAGFHLVISQNSNCRMVSNVVATVDTTTIHLEWRENGYATAWEVEYGLKGFNLGDGMRQTVSTTAYADVAILTGLTITCEITNLRRFSNYDVYIRPACGGAWFGPILVETEAPYWTDVVTSQPDGYMEDENGDIFISSAEGLAWLSKLIQENTFSGRNVVLTDDINLAGYKWMPIFDLVNIFDGQGHKIDSMYCVEKEGRGSAFITSLQSSGTIKNIYLTNCYSKQLSGLRAAGLVENTKGTIMNCFVSGIIEGTNDVGAITCFQYHSLENDDESLIINCATNCIVRSSTHHRSQTSGIVADGFNNNGGGIIRNCYTASTILSQSVFKGSILSLGANMVVENCYAHKARNGNIRIVNIDHNVIVRDIGWFNFVGDGFNLLDSIYFEQDERYYSELTEVLNAGVRKYNMEGLRLWVQDTLGLNEGMPVLGPEYVITCPNVNHLKAKNVFGENGEIGVELAWEEQGNACAWEIEYHLQDSINKIRVQTINNPDTIWGLQEHSMYLFSIRPICGVLEKGGWCEELQIVIDRPYWIDIVTSRPNGYYEDTSGNVTISTAEGLAWLISVVNGLNGEQRNTFENKTVTLTQDINISQYKWTAINDFKGTFYGNNKIISGLYVNELTNNQGMFGQVSHARFSNIVLDKAMVKGQTNVGTLIGEALFYSLINCHTSGTVSGNSTVGGMIGRGDWTYSINLCSSSGKVSAEIDQAGGLIGILTGYVEGDEVTIRNCFSMCDVHANRYGAGGLIGSTSANISNCYALGNVTGDQYQGGIVSSFVGYKNQAGIIADFSYNKMENCYFGGKVSKTLPMIVNGIFEGYLFGAITGKTMYDVIISNNYGLNDEEPFVLVGPDETILQEGSNSNRSITNTVTFEKKAGDNVLLDNVIIGQNQYSDLLSALNAWVDANNSEGIYLHWAPDMENINGGFPVFANKQPFKYVVIFENYDGSPLYTDTLNIGEKPQYVGETPTKPSTAEYTYTFAGWLPEETMVTGDATYTATYTAVKNSYTVTWLNEDGCMIDQTTVEYGQYPAHAEPTKDATAEYTYTFAGWSPAIEAVTGDATYTATYTAVKNSYTVTWLNEDGCMIDQTTVEYGQYPAHAEPTKDATAEYTYTFAGWSPEVVSVTGDVTYTATYAEVFNEYTIRFVDEDGTEILVSTDPYGEWPSEPAENPEKPSSAEYTYTFAGWSPAIEAVTGDATYTATYDQIVNEYNVTFYVDGVQYGDVQSVAYGSAATTPVTPEKTGYTFIGWDKTFSAITDNLEVNALFTINKYLVVFTDDWGTELKRDSVPYGESAVAPVPNVYSGYDFIGWSCSFDNITKDTYVVANYEISMFYIEFINWNGELLQGESVWYNQLPEYHGIEPSRPSTEQYTYRFKAWTPELTPAVAPAKYIAEFDSILNKYAVRFQNEDGTELQSIVVEYGTMPSYTGATPTKPTYSNSFNYVFNGWSPEVVSVTGDVTYTATYAEVFNEYTIRFVDEDGTEILVGTYHYGDWPSEPAENPEKPSSAEYTYTFAGWSPEVVSVTGDVTYTATYSSILREYAIKYVDYDGTILEENTAFYGDWPSGPAENPARLSDDQYNYVFVGWLPEETMVTGDATYTATYTAVKNSYIVTFVDWDGTELKVEVVEYGQAATPPEEPAREGYDFAGWDQDFDFITEDVVVTATYKLSDGGPTSVDNIYGEEETVQKIFEDNHVYIIRNGEKYDATGKQVR